MVLIWCWANGPTFGPLDHLAYAWIGMNLDHYGFDGELLALTVRVGVPELVVKILPMNLEVV